MNIFGLFVPERIFFFQSIFVIGIFSCLILGCAPFQEKFFFIKLNEGILIIFYLQINHKFSQNFQVLPLSFDLDLL